MVLVCTAHSAELDGSNSSSTLVDTCGTLMYVAPEICSSKHAPHSFPVDWWALGCVLYEMLVGK
jgi:serine/threonine protein kinase